MTDEDNRRTLNTAIINKLIGRTIHNIRSLYPSQAEMERLNLPDMIRETAERMIANEIGTDIELETPAGLHAFNNVTVAALAITALRNVNWNQIGDPEYLYKTDTIINDFDEDLATLLCRLCNTDDIDN